MAEEFTATAVLQHKVYEVVVLEAGEQMYHKREVHASEDIPF